MALIHSRNSEAHHLAEVCCSQRHYDVSNPGGPVLVCGRGEDDSAAAAMPLLRIIGAWRGGTGPANNLTELQAHLAVGGLLGYHTSELRGLHKTWHEAGEAQPFERDIAAAMAAVPPHVAHRIKTQMCGHYVIPRSPQLASQGSAIYKRE